jgi:pyrroline-5-carboxylate reductase
MQTNRALRFYSFLCKLDSRRPVKKRPKRKSATRPTVVFLGGGGLTQAMVAGLKYHAANVLRGKPAKFQLIVHDRHPNKLQTLRRLGAKTESNLQRAVDAADILLIAVRPDSVAGLLASLNLGGRSPLAVSLAAGIPMEGLRRELGPPVRWARAMPSPACRTGRGLTALAFGAELKPAERKTIRTLFAALGTVLEVPEESFDVFMVTYAPIHGYHALAALTAAATRLGLDPAVASTAATHALADGIVALHASRTSLEAALKEAATPGGISVAIAASMDASGYSAMMERALQAGIDRAKTISKA